ncbi:putative baseplate assembly protein [Agarilytica rhodophyticola]|uniref:putative baseplate assembly protein n=1 Tax=Agarilytica rhodophyticola TaxID=1737490 RepID=UPI000B3452A0|nr:putative baseplate assembly protein [Agarilytica rhodophyticola]
MPLKAPVLDNRSYQEIRDLVRDRIPRYTPEWTDFNDADPGMTLVQLFAWLTEQTLYQMNRLPDRNYIKFLKLLNMELRPPQPAQADLTFAVQKGAKLRPVLKGSQVAAQSQDSGELVVFETDEGMDLIPYPLTHVQVYDGSSFADVTETNSIRQQNYRPFGWAPQLNSALYLGFEPPEQNPAAGERAFPQQIRLRVFLPASSQAGEAQSCSQQHQRPPAPVRLVWEYRHPEPPNGWRPMTVFKDETAAMTREGYIVLEGPAQLARTYEGKVTDVDRLWLRCRLDRDTYPAGTVPEIDFIRPNTVRATALSTIRSEILGASEGHPDQRFSFRHKPIQQDDLIIRIDRSNREGVEQEYWTRVEDFLASEPDDAHFVLNASAGEIEFGNGVRGRIPVAGSEIIAERYRHGGGDSSNVAADTITLALSTLGGVQSITNERAALGGKDEQDIEEFKSEAPLAIRNRNRAVTADDFIALAKLAGGVSRATALPLRHLDYPDVDVAGAITVVIVPENDELPPLPSADLIRYVCGYLSNYRLITNELFVKGPEFSEISVVARVAADPLLAFGAVELAVKQAIDAQLHPQSRAFGLDLVPTSLFGVVLAVEGVRAVLDLALLVNGLPHDDLTEVVVLPPDGLVYGANHQITVVELEDR